MRKLARPAGTQNEYSMVEARRVSGAFQIFLSCSLSSHSLVRHGTSGYATPSVLLETSCQLMARLGDDW